MTDTYDASDLNGWAGFDDSLCEEDEMPTYTYTCKSCGKTLTLLRSIAERDVPGVNCLCGGEIERTADAPDFSVKGGTPRFYPRK